MGWPTGGGPGPGSGCWPATGCSTCTCWRAARWWPSRGSTSGSTGARWWPCSGRRGRASRPCWPSSAAWSGRRPGGSCSTASTSAGCRRPSSPCCAGAGWGSSGRARPATCSRTPRPWRTSTCRWCWPGCRPGGAGGGPRCCWTPSTSARSATSRSGPCPAASSSGWRWRWPWPTTRPCCWPTSRPASSTGPACAGWWSCSGRPATTSAPPWSWSPTTPRWPRPWTGP